MKARKTWPRVANDFALLAAMQFLTVALFATIFVVSCSDKTETLITLWTDEPDFAPYIELFNNAHESEKMLLVYKENPAQSLVSDEEPPDIAVGAWLCTDDMARRFQSVDNLFENKTLSSDIFYPPLLDAGKVRETQYLIPVSFNLPAVIFSKENAEHIENDYVLSLDEMRQAGQAFNLRRDDGVYTRIGFAPQANGDFLYLVAKAKGAHFRASNGGFNWNNNALLDALAYVRGWHDENDSSEAERDFIYKYLSMPGYRQINSGRTLFAYMTSDELFRLANEQTEFLDFRWICENGKILVEDSLAMLGIPRHAKNKKAAQVFIEWFFSVETQREIFEYKRMQGLDAGAAGIAGGFSSIREVNEQVLPAYKTMLLSDAPPAEMLEAPEKLPARWATLKTQIVIPYLQDMAAEITDATLEERIDEWTRQNYE